MICVIPKMELHVGEMGLTSSPCDKVSGEQSSAHGPFCSMPPHPNNGFFVMQTIKYDIFTCVTLAKVGLVMGQLRPYVRPFATLLG